MTPHNIPAEQSVLGSLLLDNDAIDRVGDLRIEHFYTSDHRAIFAEIKRQITAGKSADVISVGVALTTDDALPYLNSLAQNTPSSANIARYAEIVRDRALRRGLIAETSRLADLAMSDAQTACAVLEMAESAISKLSEQRVMREPILASQAMIAHCEVLDGRMEKKFSGIPTGFTEIDRNLNGGVNRGNLVILGARPSMGKTALAVNVATNCARDYGVLVLSQEMQTGELLDRITASMGKVNLGRVIRGEMEQDDWDRFTAANSRLMEMNLHLDDQPALTILDVRQKARLVKRKHGLDVLIVDYLQLMTGAGDNRNSQIEEISRGLKSLAKELNIVVYALSQLSRNAANQSRPRLSDLRDSGAIEQDADIVMFLHRAEVDDPNSYLRGIADVFIAKNRQGALADVMLNYEGQYTQFTDASGYRPEAPKQASRRGLAANL